MSSRKKMIASILGFCAFFLSVQSRNLNEARLFGDAYIKTVTESQMVTTLVPSSCVQVNPTLPPCRSVRYLRFPILENYISSYNNLRESTMETTALSWGEYLGFYLPTVTVTETEIHTATVQDPSIIVTFAVRGCRPLRLPMDLDRCPPDEPLIQEVLPTSTVVLAKQIEATSVQEVFPTTSVALQDNFRSRDNFLEASNEENLELSHTVEPTEALNNI